MSMSWRDDFLTGVQLIDEQHRVIFDLINSLEEHRNDVDTGKVLQFIEEYGRLHFAQEEEMLMLGNSPLLVPHRSEHLYFLGKIQEWTEQFAAHRISQAQLVQILRKWWEDHILGMDMVCFRGMDNY